jgi:hypothetical protein
MLPTADELRDESRLCRKAAEDAADIDTRERLGKYAFLLALLAEAVERDGRGDAEAGADERINRLRMHAERLRAISADVPLSSAHDSLRRMADSYDQLAGDAAAGLVRRSAVIDKAG